MRAWIRLQSRPLGGEPTIESTQEVHVEALPTVVGEVVEHGSRLYSVVGTYWVLRDGALLPIVVAERQVRR